MALSEFWVQQVVDFVRRLRAECERCPACGALACGQKHENWHTAVQNKLDEARDEIISLRQRATAAETKFTEIDANFTTVSQAIQGLRNRMTAAENEITGLKTRVTALGG